MSSWELISENLRVVHRVNLRELEMLELPTMIWKINAMMMGQSTLTAETVMRVYRLYLKAFLYPARTWCVSTG